MGGAGGIIKRQRNAPLAKTIARSGNVQELMQRERDATLQSIPFKNQWISPKEKSFTGQLILSAGCLSERRMGHGAGIRIIGSMMALLLAKPA